MHVQDKRPAKNKKKKRIRAKLHIMLIMGILYTIGMRRFIPNMLLWLKVYLKIKNTYRELHILCAYRLY